MGEMFGAAGKGSGHIRAHEGFEDMGGRAADIDQDTLALTTHRRMASKVAAEALAEVMSFEVNGFGIESVIVVYRRSGRVVRVRTPRSCRASAYPHC